MSPIELFFYWYSPLHYILITNLTWFYVSFVLLSAVIKNKLRYVKTPYLYDVKTSPAMM